MDHDIYAADPAAIDDIRRIVTEKALLDKPGDPANLKQDDVYYPGGSVFRDGAAIINISGVIYPRLYWYGTDPERIMQAVGHALSDRYIERIVLRVDSPGGSATGVNELSNYIYDRRGEKPITAYVAGAAASAAYWIASAADEIITDATGRIGSIGAFISAYKRADDEVFIISHQSPAKEVDPENKEVVKSLQNRVNAMAEVFIESVARNRGVSIDTVKNDFGRGATLVGQQAVSAGLADGIGSLESIICNTHNEKGRDAMSKDDVKTSDAVAVGSVEELASAYPAIVDKIKTTAHNAGYTEGKAEGLKEGAKTENENMTALIKCHFGDQAAAGFADLVKKTTDIGVTPQQYAAIIGDTSAAQVTTEESAELVTKKELLKGLYENTGADNPGTDAGAGASADFMALVDAYKAEKNCSSTEAMAAVAKANPGVHDAYLKKVNNKGGE